ncbi:MAG: RagB/SusD family nutrient uptake outer membrane protein [Bacteroidetes bacterium]|nr:RagB/SusD family nutrient uptake outer membrane protein [Bacteroidota bacterium]
MKTQNISKALFLTTIVIALFSCTKDLDRNPFYGLNQVSVYEDPANYKHVLAKLYAGYALTGNQGPAGKPDITGFDEGSSGLLRSYWNLQELTTDEAVCAWNDPGIPELHKMTWSSENSWVKYTYYRIYFEVAMCNKFIRETSDDKMSSRGFSDADKAAISVYRNEARFLRALAYYMQLDLFGKGPFITEADQAGAFFPPEKDRAFLYSYVESELLAIESSFSAPKSLEYARADKAAVWMLLSRLYLNSEVYIGTSKYDQAVTYSKRVIDAGYILDPTYANLFLADNNNSPEFIFPITSDGLNTQTYGATTYLVHAAIGGSMSAANFGVASGWAGLRSTKGLQNCFIDPATSAFDSVADHRWLFYSTGQNLDILDLSKFKDGYAVAKWKNITSTGAIGSDPTKQFVDTDFPFFRLAEAYLTYAEATVRGGNGDMGLAIGYINELRQRAYGDASHNVASIDLPFLLNERGRELYWEGNRRTDLIRYGYFTTASYLWPWKGGVQDGQAVGSYLNIFPIPLADLAANTNLHQNPGY